MDIKELYFIIDFLDQLDHLEDDLDNFGMEISDGVYSEDMPESARNHFWALVHQCKALQKIFNSLKESVDEKYWEVWKSKHPQCTSTYEPCPKD